MVVLHPLSVHFPLALLLASSLCTLLALRWPETAWASSAYHCLLLGWFAGLPALLSGLIDAAQQLSGPTAWRDGAVIAAVNQHAFSSLAAMLVYGRALLLHRRQPELLADPAARRSYLGLHGLGAALLMLAGWLGGQLVYELGLGVQV